MPQGAPVDERQTSDRRAIDQGGLSLVYRSFIARLSLVYRSFIALLPALNKPFAVCVGLRFPTRAA
eukprot:9386466-Pyramimonas_sp.AAC.1